jgi:glucose-6-phosphate 1-epimerase
MSFIFKPPSSTSITIGLGGMPKVCLAAPDGARAEVYLHGAHVTAWVPAGSEDRLFLSQASAFRPDAAIRGGIPVIFPQFGSLGRLTKHGFARNQSWDLTSLSGDNEIASAKFVLQENDATWLLWPHTFQAELTVSVGGTNLELELTVMNTGDQSFSFTAALHTYLRVKDILTTDIKGLHGIRFHDTVNRPTPADWIEDMQIEPAIHFPDEVDRVYYNVPQPLMVCEPERITTVNAVGFPDAVIWNPGPEKAARLSDMEPEGYRHMVCVEAAIASAPVTLGSGAAWQGAQILSS